jgi:hypothetical protein
MNSSLHPGVTFYEDDRGNGPFMIRIGGTKEFVSLISDGHTHRSRKIELCEGWRNSSALTFKTMEEALTAADKVWDIEGFHTSIETVEWA